MDPFTLQRRVCRDILKSRPTTGDGMGVAIRAVAASPGGKAWAEAEAAAPAWASLEDRWVKWFDGLLKKAPPPSPTGLLWFERPSDLNPAMTSVSGYATLDASDEAWGLEAGRHWPKDASGSTLPAALLKLPELDCMFVAAGWTWGRDTDESLYPGFFALASAATLLLVLNALPRTRVLSVVGVNRIGVLTGWMEGGEEPVGTLSTAGWVALKRVKGAKAAKPEELDPTHYSFDVLKYLAAGGDPRWADPKTGKNLLMSHRHDDLPVIRALLSAGADTKARSRDGATVLHWFGAADLPVLDALVNAGADPTAVMNRGHSVFDQIASDGRCTVAHLDWCWNRGGRPGTSKGGDAFPLHEVAESNIYERTRAAIVQQLIRSWRHHGCDINALDKRGRTPLWRALESHARELVEHDRRGLRRSEVVGTWDYRHDDVAIMMLDEGADPNVRLKRSGCRLVPAGATPLMVRRYDDDRLVKALLKHGADPTLVSAAGKTALDYARAATARRGEIGREGVDKVVAVLERAVAKWKPAATPRPSARASRPGAISKSGRVPRSKVHRKP